MSKLTAQVILSTLLVLELWVIRHCIVVAYREQRMGWVATFVGCIVAAMVCLVTIWRE